MIFTNDYTNQEMSKAFLSQNGNKWRLFVYALLCSLVCFVISLLLYSLDSTIIYEWLPTFSGANARSMFTLLTILTLVIIVFTTFYFFGHYNTFTFAELHTNRMYMLIKNGENMKKVVFLRILSALILPIILYLASYIISLLICLIFGYTLNITAMPGMFVSGIIVISLTIMTILTISLFIYEAKYGFMVFLFLFIAVWVFASLSGYIRIIQTSINLTSFSVLFGESSNYFLYYALLAIFVLFIICIFRSQKLIKFYTTRKFSMPSGIIIMNYSKNTRIKPKKDNTLQKEKVFSRVIYSIFGIFALFSFVTNIFLIYMGTNNLETQSLYNKFIPTIFSSQTLTQGDNNLDPTLSKPQFIENNDLAIFESATDNSVDIKVGNIIYYIDNETSNAVIEKVLFIDGDNYSIDVTYYPNKDDQGKLATTINRNQIKGVLVYVNRSLGAWITLNESTIGKIVFLAVPLSIIIFYDNFRKLILAYHNVEENEYYFKQRKK